MSARPDNAGFERAETIIGASRVAAAIAALQRRADAAAAGSTSIAAIDRVVRAVRGMPAGERARCAALAVAVAMAGHAILAAIEPPRARPTIWLTVPALLAMALAATALFDHTREP